MDKIQIEVAYASTTEHQTLLTLRVEPPCTVEKAILLSGVLDIYPEIELSNQIVGIWSRPCELTHLVQSGDRIEIYRPLVQTPEERRRKKAQIAKKLKKIV